MAEPSVDPGYLLKAVRSYLLHLTGLPEASASQDAAATLPLEETGCLVWDVAALPDDAAFLVQQGLPAMLAPALAAAAARQQWRGLEMGLGTLGNLACHAAVQQQLLEQAGLPELLLEQLLWVDDPPSVAELCRCLAALLAGAGSTSQVRGQRDGGGRLRRMHVLLGNLQTRCRR